MEREKHPHQPRFNPLTSWNGKEVRKGFLYALAAALVGSALGILMKDNSPQKQPFEPLPIPLSNRWSDISPQGWRVRQTEELLPKGTFNMSGVPLVINKGEFEIDGRRTGIVLSGDTFLQVNKKDEVPVVRATIVLDEGKKDDILLTTFSDKQRWMVTFEHLDSETVRHFHILPLPDGKLQVVPMELTGDPPYG